MKSCHLWQHGWTLKVLSSQPRDQTHVSSIAGKFFTSWASREAQEYWSGYHIPSSVNCPTPGIEPGGLLHCRWILYQLSYQGILNKSCRERQIPHDLSNIETKIKKKNNKENQVHPYTDHISGCRGGGGG